MVKDHKVHDLIHTLGEAHYTFLGLWPGHIQTRQYGATLVGNHLIPVPFRNHATFVRTHPGEVDRLIAAAQEFYRNLAAPPAFQLDPATAPDDFATSLASAGYQKQVEEAWMVFGRQQAGGERPNPQVEIERIEPNSTEKTIQAYVDCYNVSFRSPPNALDGMGDSFRGVLPHTAGIHYLGRVGGKPAGSMSLFFEGSLGAVYNVGTFPAFRGQGVATTLLLCLLEDAKRLGVQTLFLQAVHNGPAQPLYIRLGFRTQFLRHWFLPHDPGGIWTAHA